MTKVKIKTKLKTKEQNFIFEIKGILSDNKLRYQENETKVEITLQKDSIQMIRTVNQISKIEMNFIESQKTTCIYHLLEYNKKINLSILTHKINRKNQSFMIEYEIEGQDGHNQFEFEYEVIK